MKIKSFYRKLVAGILLCLLVGSAVAGNIPGTRTASEITAEKSAKEKYLFWLEHPESFPVSFTYGEKQYYGFRDDFTLISRDGSNEGIKDTATLLFQNGNLQVTVDTAFYNGYDAYEWTVWFENVGESENTEIIADLNAADISFTGDAPMLKGIYGDIGNLYREYSYDLTREPVSFTSKNGRPTHGNFPYFNLEHGNGGTMIALGWGGTWKADFVSDEEKTHFTAGQYEMSTYLEPGEKIRTPLMAFVEYGERDDDVAVNAWRRWFIDCNMPSDADGGQRKPQLAVSYWQMHACMATATEEVENALIRRWIEDERIPVDFLWMDAGWYIGPNDQSVYSLWQTGIYEVDRHRFPQGLQSVVSYVHGKGVRATLWFEPEVPRLTKAQLLENGYKEEWLFDTYVHSTLTAEYDAYLVNLGNDEARQWLTDKIYNVLVSTDVDMYRSDFNTDPGIAWRAEDTEGRTGITENKYVQGYYAMWDDLTERIPGLMIDSCASGGGRNDLESMRRAVPLTITDYAYSDYETKQAMWTSLSKWLPYFGQVTNDGDADSMQNIDIYALRSSYRPFMTYVMALTGAVDAEVIRQSADEWNRIKDYYLSDYYALTSYDRSSFVWKGWEYFDPDTDGGFVQLFRPEEAVAEDFNLCLRGLKNDTIYVITNADNDETLTASGMELMTSGFTVTLPEPRSSALLFIEKLGEGE